MEYEWSNVRMQVKSFICYQETEPMKKLFLLPILALIAISASYQDSMDPDKWIGMWKMDKHTYLIKEAIKGKIKDVEHECDFGVHFPILQISADNSFSIKHKGKVIEKGNWGFKAPDTLWLKNRKALPADPLVNLEDRRIQVIKVSGSELQLKEHQCSQKFIGTSVYKKL